MSASDVTWRSDGRREGLVVGSTPALVLHRAMVEAAAEALRAGVTVQRLAHLRGVDRRDELRRLREDLAAQIKVVKRREANAELTMLDAETDEQRRRGNELVRELQRQRADLEQQLSATDDHVADTLPDVLHGALGEHLLALASLATRDRLDPAAAQAVGDIVRDFTLKPTDARTLHFQFSLRLPLSDGVYLLGPVQGEVSNRSRGSQLDLRGLPSEASRRLSRDDTAALGQVLDQLLVDGRVPTKAVHALQACALPHVPHALLAALRGTDPPAWLPAAWRNPDWIQHLVNVYTDRDFTWSRSLWCVTSTTRQLLTDLVADGPMTVRELQAALAGTSLGPSILTKYSDPAGTTPAAWKPWMPSVVRTGGWQRGGRAPADRGLGPVQCPTCGSAASRIVRVPEIPGDLLCGHCRTAPAAPDLDVPKEYIGLAVGRAQADRAAAGRGATR